MSASQVSLGIADCAQEDLLAVATVNVIDRPRRLARRHRRRMLPRVAYWSMCWPIGNTLFSNNADCASMPLPVIPRWISAPSAPIARHPTHDVVDARAGTQRVTGTAGRTRAAIICTTSSSAVR
jgi:hypothetical protein